METLPFVKISVKRKRGYGVDEISGKISDAQLYAIRKNFAIGGQDLSPFAGTKFIRTIPLPNKSIGWMEVKVTQKTDEFGRSGLLESTTTVIPENMVGTFAQKYLSSFKPKIVSAINRYMPDVLDQFTLNKIEFALRAFSGKQIIITAPFLTYKDWNLVNIIVVKLFLSLPYILQSTTFFSTFCLTQRDTGTIIAIPDKFVKGEADINISRRLWNQRQAG